LSFKIWKSVYTNFRFRSWSSKPLSENAALVLFGPREKLKESLMLIRTKNDDN